MILAPYQVKGLAEFWDAYAAGHKRIVLTCPTGGGKTVMMGEVLLEALRRMLSAIVYVNKRLLTTQTSEALEEMEIPFGVRAAGHGEDSSFRVQLASMQTEHARLKSGKWGMHHSDIVIVDECFTGDTLISTPRGDVRIDNVRPGDTVHCATGIGVVEAVSVKPCQAITRLEYSNGKQIRCTGSHPIFTGTGWVQARKLEIGSLAYGIEDVRRLWENVQASPVGEKRASKRNSGIALDSSDFLLSILLKEGQEPNERQSQRRQNGKKASGNQAQAYQNWRQRAIASLVSTGTTSRTGKWLGVGISDTDENAEGKWVSDRIQGGHRKPGKEVGNRNRRDRPQLQVGKREGRKENKFACQPWLVSSSCDKRESPIPVFNLQVNGHPSYFANGILVHNCHVQQGKTAKAIFDKHVESGACILGLTATPLDMGEIYDHLIVAGTNSELRECGRLVPAIHYGCDEPDIKALKLKVQEGVDLTEKENKKAIMTPTIFARVLDWYKKLNPAGKPALLFGPGVSESLWFAEKFVEAGIPAAHIDGSEIWMNGEFLTEGRKARKIVADASRTGEVKVVCNRYVLREGVNWPWIEHLILAFVAGSLQTYLQIGGRGLRASPETGKTQVIIQDHGGCWWRHGSLNADRNWDLRYTNSIVSSLRADRMRAKKEREPWCCPACKQILNRARCTCGWEKPPRPSRPVVQANGELREMVGDIFTPRRIYQKPNGEKLWEKMYYRSKTEKGQRTFRAAFALFAQENYFQWPDPSWRFMPKKEMDKYRLVKDVSVEDLH